MKVDAKKIPPWKGGIEKVSIGLSRYYDPVGRNNTVYIKRVEVNPIRKAAGIQRIVLYTNSLVGSFPLLHHLSQCIVHRKCNVAGR
jgi:hypothetical protein